jgi:galactokinase
MDETDTIRLRPPIDPGPVTWSSYVEGVVAGLTGRGWSPPAFDAVIQSSVPVGGGLSSSAALEVAIATLLEAICEKELEPVDKALLCQKAEHTFAGVPCGIMDQFSSVMCQADTLMLLDCRSQEVELVPFADAGISVVIANTNVKHELTGGEYAQRRGTCEAVARVLRVDTLRDATMDRLLDAEGQLDAVQLQRARHVISEIDRTMAAAEAIQSGDWRTVGDLMYASHASLRDDYEVSCEELDLMVDMAADMGFEGGVIGSRMTGGGFGGCTVSLVRSDSADAFIASLHKQYEKETGIEPSIFATRPSQGAMILET